jgi:ferrous iron transport protein B
VSLLWQSVHSMRLVAESTRPGSLWDGFVGGAAIVLPYLVPFLFGLALLEDVGYLPRVAYFLDGFFHRIGLHGTSIVPILLGYGCSVPACLATRVLPSRRDRFLAGVLATLVPGQGKNHRGASRAWSFPVETRRWPIGG